MPLLHVFLVLTVATTGHFLKVHQSISSNALEEEDKYSIVEVLHGKLRGTLVNTKSANPVVAFLGVPYAKPPIGKLRFKPPEVPEPWNGVLNATSFSDSCMQRDVFHMKRIPAMKRFLPTTPFSEDCLYLNVWVPRKILSSQNASVIVFIHGGKFSSGSTSVPTYDGSTLASEENLILVSMNYRLNSFGFLNLDHPDCPGNVAFLDQVFALKWIKDNIGFFGGNASDVTLVGHSAGSTAVGYHLISPESTGLFRRAVMQSGGPTSEWILQSKNTSLALSTKLAENVGCYAVQNKTALIGCLQGVNANDLIEAEPAEGIEFSVFRPTVDGKFLTSSPRTLYQSTNFTGVEVMIGVTKEEGTTYLISIMPSVFTLVHDKARPTHRDIQHVVRELFPNAQPFVYSAIELFYTSWKNPDDPDHNLHSVNSLLSDTFFVCSVNEVSQAMAEKGGKVFRYMYAYRSIGDLTPKWTGSYHGSELTYIFGEPVKFAKGYSQQETRFSKRMMKYWANFARTGSPNSLDDDVSWPPYTVGNKAYVVLSPNSRAVGQRPRDRACTFWRDVFPHLTNVTINW